MAAAAADAQGPPPLPPPATSPPVSYHESLIGVHAVSAEASVVAESCLHSRRAAARGEEEEARNNYEDVDSDDEPMQPSGRKEQGMPLKVVARLVGFAIASGLLFGIDLGAIGAALNGLSTALGLSKLQSESIVAGCKGGAIAGCLLGGAWMTAYGRRRAVAIAIVAFLAGPALLALANSFWMALLGRLLNGVGVGAASVAVPCYLSEVSTPSCRGTLVACYEVAIALGFLTASIVNTLIEGLGSCPGGCWRYQGGVLPSVATVPLMLVLSQLPESPRWVLSRAGGNAGMMRKALDGMSKLGCNGAKDRINIIKQIQSRGGEDEAPGASPWHRSDNDLVAIWDRQHLEAGSPLLLSETAERARPLEVSEAPSRTKARWVLLSTFQNVCTVATDAPGVPAGARRGLGLAVGLAVLNQACASTAVLEYAQRLLREVGVTSRHEADAMAIAVAGAKTLGVAFGLLLVGRVGRKPLLGWGGAVSALMLVLVAVGSAYREPATLLIGLCTFILVFVATWGNGYWVVVTEVTAPGGPEYGASSQAAATAVLFAAGWVTSFTFVSIVEAGGSWTVLTYAGIAALMSIFAFGMLPETRGLSLEECAAAVAAASSRGRRRSRREDCGGSESGSSDMDDTSDDDEDDHRE